MFENLRSRIDAILHPGGSLQTNAMVTTPLGQEYPYHSGYEDTRIDSEKLLTVSEMGQVDRLLWQVWLIIDNGRDKKIITPEDQDPKKLADKVALARKMLWRVDRHIGASVLRAQAWTDCVIEGSGLVEVGIPGKGESWYRMDGWKMPAYGLYLDAASFNVAPAQASNPQLYVPGRTLPGIVYDKENRQLQFWQTDGSALASTQIPTEKVLQVKDPRSRYPDGKSYLRGIVPDASQLEYTRKALMQNVARWGVPTAVLRVKQLRDAQGRPIADPLKKESGTQYQNDWKRAENNAKYWGNNRCIVLTEGQELEIPTQTFNASIIKVDEHLSRILLQHLIPRDWIEQSGAAIGKSSTSLLELALIVAHAWRSIVSAPFDELDTIMLEEWGFTDWAVESTFKDPDFQDKTAKRQESLEAFKAKAITLERYYLETGRDPPTKEEKDELRQFWSSSPPAAAANSLQRNAEDEDPALELLKKGKSRIAVETLKEFGYL